MLIEEFIIALAAGIIATLGTILIFARFKSSPVEESRFFILGAVFFTVYFYCVLPLTIMIDPKTDLFFLKLAPVFGDVGVFILSLSILLPTVATKYRNIFFVILLAVLMTTASIINFQTITYSVSARNFAIISYTSPLSFLLMVSNGLSYVGVLVVRIRNVASLMRKNKGLFADRYILKFRFYFIYLILIIVTITTLILNRTIEQGAFPGFTWYFPISLAFLYLGYAIYKDESFLFITPSKLEGILISNKNGLLVYSKNFMSFGEDNSVEASDLFTNILNAFDISMKSNLQSEKNLEQIIYGDKIILSFNGEFVTTFLIVTQNNLIIQSIAKYLNNKFEKRYRTNLLAFNDSGILEPQLVNNFDEEIDYIKNFIPL